MTHPGGRPSYKPTDKDRRTVKALAGFGTSHEDIAQTIGIDPKTLRKHFRKELDAGVIEANAKVAQSLYVRATTMTGNPGAQVTAAIWWTKARMGWSDKTRTEITGADGGPVQVSGPQIFIPPETDE